MTPKEFNITEYSKAFISKIKHYENKNVLFIGFDDIDVISEIINQKYKNCNIYIVDNKETCDCIPLLNLNANIYVLNSYNEENNYIKEVFGPLNFYDDILISVWKNGASITTSALKLLKENGICVCSMLLSNYKKNELYRHVETFNLANPKLFKDAVITENLCITTCRKNVTDKYSWENLLHLSFDNRYKLVYEYSKTHNLGIYMQYEQDEPISSYDIDLDFIESGRCYSVASGAGFGINGIGYKYNVLKCGYEDWMSYIGHIHFNTKQAKDNFCKFYYNGKKGKSLASKLFLGVHATAPSKVYYYCIPQIEWSKIHINQKELWDKELYDDAVLSEMHLKWNNDKTKIIQA